MNRFVQRFGGLFKGCSVFNYSFGGRVGGLKRSYFSATVFRAPENVELAKSQALNDLRSLEALQEKKLFTPGPLCVSRAVKAALARDMGSRDTEFIEIVRNLRRTLVEIAGLPHEKYTAVLMQGSGTFGVESVLQSTIPRDKKVIIAANGAYGQRMAKICDKVGIQPQTITFHETQQVDIDKVLSSLSEKPDEYSAVAVVHSETTSGIVNPIEELGARLKSKYPEINYIVDAMSSFGGIPADYSNVDFIVSSANKCLQGIPGFAFAISNIERLKQCKGISSSLSLDLHDQWQGLEQNGQFRFTPPTHAILGLKQACKELEEEGGVAGRASRYALNASIIKKGMAHRGFKQLIPDGTGAGYIITSFYYPEHPNFKFDEFYKRLSDLGQLIYPGKVTNADCFRIGHIGDLHPSDMEYLLCCIDKVLQDMGIKCPLSN